jgi:rubrerythrin
MDIVEYALQMEKDGEEYYRKLAAEAENEGIRQIFEMLADTEVEHYQTFLKIKNNQPIPAADDRIVSKVQNVFQQMQDDGSWEKVTGDQSEAYRKARDVEMKSHEFYLEKANELTDPAQKALCQRIAEEEREHYQILDSILEFIDHPSAWMENAEWRHMDEF